MTELATNIQQLPRGMLEELISCLDVEDILSLIYVNRYFKSIALPILYKDIIYNHSFPHKPEEEEEAEDLPDRVDESDEANEADESNEADGADESNEVDESDEDESNEADESDEDENLNKVKVEFRQKVWEKLEPSVIKFNKYIESSQVINPDELNLELKKYSELKLLRLNIDTQQGIKKLIDYTGSVFKQLNRLELTIDFSLEYQVESLIPHFINLEQLEFECSRLDVKWISDFKSDLLVYIKFNTWEATTKFFKLVGENFKNLKYLDFEFYELTIDEDEVDELPVFQNVIDLKFTITHGINNLILNYLYNAKFWPKLKNLDNFILKNLTEPLVINHHRLISLYTNAIDPTTFQGWDNFTKLQVLHLDWSSDYSNHSLQALFTGLTELKDLQLRGTIQSHLFDFKPTISLFKLNIYQLTDFSSNFVAFVKQLTLCRRIELNFCKDAFNNVNLTELLVEPHNFSDLRSLELENCPDALEQWFVRGSKTLTKVVRVENFTASTRYI